MPTNGHARDSNDVILLAHGGGGLLTRRLVEELLLTELRNPVLEPLDDAARLAIPETDLAMTTDSYVVDPVFFPGGDIGKLAVCGTVNDLAMQAAEPRYISLALIIEEGFPLRDLKRIVASVARATRETGVLVATGDTKVIERRRNSQAPGIFLNTTGIGVRRPGVDVAAANAQTGDAVLVTGSIGDHGMAVMTRREGLQLESELTSDVQPLWSLVRSLLDRGVRLHCLRDPTRGGLAAALCDIARASGRGIRIREADLPVKPEVRGACKLLGIDPLNVANEGKALVLCDGRDSRLALETVCSQPAGSDARLIGEVTAEPRGTVTLETVTGGRRIVDVPLGEDLPRIC